MDLSRETVLDRSIPVRVNDENVFHWFFGEDDDSCWFVLAWVNGSIECWTVKLKKYGSKRWYVPGYLLDQVGTVNIYGVVIISEELDEGVE